MKHVQKTKLPYSMEKKRYFFTITPPTPLYQTPAPFPPDKHGDLWESGVFGWGRQNERNLTSQKSLGEKLQTFEENPIYGSFLGGGGVYEPPKAILT